MEGEGETLLPGNIVGTSRKCGEYLYPFVVAYLG